MALLLSEGFDKMSALADLTADGWSNLINSGSYTASNITVPASSGRFGGRAFKWNNVTSNILPTKAIPSHDITSTPLHASGYYYFDTISSGSYFCPLFAFFNSTGTHWIMLAHQNGQLKACAWDAASNYYNTTAAVVASWTGLTAAAWHHIEIACSVKTSGGIFKVWVDGVKVIDFSGNTKYSSNSTANDIANFAFGTSYNSAGAVYIDDVICWDESGETPNSSGPLGEHRIWTLSPDGDDSVQFTPSSGSNNYSRVNESPNDGDTSYTSSTTVGQKDYFTFTDMSVTPDTIHAIVVKTIAKKTGTGSTKVKGMVKVGSTTYEGSEVALSTSYSHAPAVFGYNPATSAAWAASAINSAKIGYDYSS